MWTRDARHFDLKPSGSFSDSCCVVVVGTPQQRDTQMTRKPLGQALSGFTAVSWKEDMKDTNIEHAGN